MKNKVQFEKSSIRQYLSNAFLYFHSAIFFYIYILIVLIEKIKMKNKGVIVLGIRYILNRQLVEFIGSTTSKDICLLLIKTPMKRGILFSCLLLLSLSLSSVMQTCTSIAGCIECPDPNTCINCDDSQHFNPKPNDQGKCSCSTGFYFNRNKCIPCQNSHPYCLACSQDGNMCTSCLDGYFVQKGSCTSCGSFCKTCKSGTQCDKCNTGYFWNGKACESCGITNCQSCEKAKLCSKCQSGYYLKHHVNPLASNFTCQKCISNCDQCSNNASCDVCMSGYYKDASQKCSLCSGLFTNCLKCSLQKCQQCKDNTLYVAESGKCQSCHTDNNHCTTCRSATDCMTCDSNIYYPSGTCKLCGDFQPGCLTCQSSTTTRCISCVDGFYLTKDYLCNSCSTFDQHCSLCIESKCNKCIGEFQYFINNENLCEACSDIQGCVHCTGPNACTECLPNFLKQQNQCIECKTLIDNCLKCSSAEKCDSCIDNYFFKQDKCLQCNQIIQNCNTCSTNGDFCEICVDGYFSKDNQCSPCSSISDKCIKCSNDGKCSKCADASFIDGNTCTLCTDKCAICTSAQACDTCISGYIPQNKLCVSCSSKIKYCSKCTSTTECQTCDGGAILTPTKTCSTCAELFNNCVSCDIKSCTVCQASYKLQSGSCTPQSSPIAGIIVGIVGGIAVVGLAGYYLFRRMKRKQQASKNTIITEQGQGGSIAQEPLLD